MHQWKSPAAEARLAMIALWAQLALIVLWRLLGQIVGSGALGGADTDPLVAQMQGWMAFAALASLIGIAGIVTAGLWFYRVSVNAHVLNPDMKHHPLMLLWFLVPVANWIVPYFTTREIWKVTADAAGQTRGGWVLPVWWTAFVINGVVGAFAQIRSFVGAFGAIPSPQPPLPDWYGYLSLILSAASVITFMFVVRRLTQMQFDARDSGAHAPVATARA
jgi:hypothetical protein